MSPELVGVGAGGGVEVGAAVEVSDEADMGWAPAELLLSFRVGRGGVDGNEVGHPVEMRGCFFERFADDRQIQVAADGGGDVAEGNAFVADGVVVSAGRSFFERKAIQMRGIQAVDGGPAIRSVTDVSGDALFTRDANQTRNEAVCPRCHVPKAGGAGRTRGRRVLRVNRLPLRICAGN